MKRRLIHFNSVIAQVGPTKAAFGRHIGVSGYRVRTWAARGRFPAQRYVQITSLMPDVEVDPRLFGMIEPTEPRQ